MSILLILATAIWWLITGPTQYWWIMFLVTVIWIAIRFLKNGMETGEWFDFSYMVADMSDLGDSVSSGDFGGGGDSGGGDCGGGD